MQYALKGASLAVPSGCGTCCAWALEARAVRETTAPSAARGNGFSPGRLGHCSRQAAIAAAARPSMMNAERMVSARSSRGRMWHCVEAKHWPTPPALPTKHAVLQGSARFSQQRHCDHPGRARVLRLHAGACAPRLGLKEMMVSAPASGRGRCKPRQESGWKRAVRNAWPSTQGPQPRHTCSSADVTRAGCDCRHPLTQRTQRRATTSCSQHRPQGADRAGSATLP